MRKVIIFLLFISIPLLGVAQGGYNKKHKKRSGSKSGSLLKKHHSSNSFVKKKSKPRKEIIIGIGAANFLGDLGGANQIGTFFVKDFEFSMTKPSAQLAYRYRMKPYFAVKGGFYYQLVSGEDNLTKEPYRENRNLSFRSNIFELSIQAEFYFLKSNQSGHIYNIKGAKGKKSFEYEAYGFLGIGGFYFNPKAKYNGSWVSLQPLGTEGQGLAGQPKKYSRVNVCIPYGLGATTAINKEWKVGLEIGMRYTFTDYIDDVSGKYYDNNAIRSARGDVAADLADPSLHNYPESLGGDASGYKQSAAGQDRGHTDHTDSYFFINVTLTYKIPARHKTRSKF